MRFKSERLRLLSSFTFLLATVPYMGVVLYGPSIALSSGLFDHRLDLLEMMIRYERLNKLFWQSISHATWHVLLDLDHRHHLHLLHINRESLLLKCFNKFVAFVPNCLHCKIDSFEFDSVSTEGRHSCRSMDRRFASRAHVRWSDCSHRKSKSRSAGWNGVYNQVHCHFNFD